jgi:cystathionine beta-lyase
MNRWTEITAFEPSPGDPYHPNATPIYQTATFAQPSATSFGRYDYSRSGNPTRDVLQRQIAKLEGTKHAFAFASGMAALAATTRLLDAGDHVIAGVDLYGGTHRLLSQVLSRQAITVSYVDTSDTTAVARAVTPATRLVLIETPTNPQQRVADIRALAVLAHDVGALLAVDNTLLSPWLQQPARHGADLVVHSATKHLGGHSDVTAGAVATNDDALAEKLAFTQNAEGTALAPFDSWLLLRGLQTLPLRIERQQTTAGRIAQFLFDQPRVTAVHYPGLASHPGRDIHFSQASGAGSVISFETGDVHASEQILAALELFTISVSFGSLHSLASLPCRMSHASIPASVRQVGEDLIRVSIGIEDADDLIADLRSALDRVSLARSA